LATIKLAVICQGSVRRLAGDDPARAATTGELVDQLAQMARQLTS
jgi:hypothetical protein